MKVTANDEQNGFRVTGEGIDQHLPEAIKQINANSTGWYLKGGMSLYAAHLQYTSIKPKNDSGFVSR
jgi:hypothetical protein